METQPLTVSSPHKFYVKFNFKSYNSSGTLLFLYQNITNLIAVLRIRIPINRIHIFLDLPDPDPLVTGIHPDPAPDPDRSVFMHNIKKHIDSYFFPLFHFLYDKLYKCTFQKNLAQRKCVQIFFPWYHDQ
jgi:hypothetical protein